MRPRNLLLERIADYARRAGVTPSSVTGRAFKSSRFFDRELRRQEQQQVNLRRFDDWVKQNPIEESQPDGGDDV